MQGEGAEASHCAANLYSLYSTAFGVCVILILLSAFMPWTLGDSPER